MKAIALLVAAGFMAGCSSAPGRTYKVYLDPNMSATQQQDVIDAGASWEAAVPVQLSFAIQPCSGIHTGEVCVHLSGTAPIDMATGHLEIGDASTGNDGAEIWLPMAEIASLSVQYNMPWLAHQTYVHELGHAMGLQHWNGTYAVMDQDSGSSSHGPITCNDVIQWYSVRSAVAPDCQ